MGSMCCCFFTCISEKNINHKSQQKHFRKVQTPQTSPRTHSNGFCIGTIRSESFSACQNTTPPISIAGWGQWGRRYCGNCGTWPNQSGSFNEKGTTPPLRRHYLKAFSQIQQSHNFGKRSICRTARIHKVSCCTTLKRDVLGLWRPLY